MWIFWEIQTKCHPAFFSELWFFLFLKIQRVCKLSQVGKNMDRKIRSTVPPPSSLGNKASDAEEACKLLVPCLAACPAAPLSRASHCLAHTGQRAVEWILPRSRSSTPVWTFLSFLGTELDAPISLAAGPLHPCGRLTASPGTRNFQPRGVTGTENPRRWEWHFPTRNRLFLHFMVCNFHRLICFPPRKKHNYFAPSCKEPNQLKNIIIAVLWAQWSWFLFVILSYYAASLQNYLDRNNYTQCSQRTTDCSKLENLILNIYIMLSCFHPLFPWLIIPFPANFDPLNCLSLKSFSPFSY